MDVVRKLSTSTTWNFLFSRRNSAWCSLTVMSSRSLSLSLSLSLSAPAGGCDGLIQQEPGTGVGAALHDKQGRTFSAVLRLSSPCCSRAIPYRMVVAYSPWFCR